MRKTQVAAGAAALFLLSLLAWQSSVRTRDWKDEITLWRDATEKSRIVSRPWVNLGVALKRAGRFDEATEAYLRALKIEPDNVRTHLDLANALKEMGRYEAALNHYHRALAGRPDDPNIEGGIGHVYQLMKEHDLALMWYKHASGLAPENAVLLNNIGSILLDSHEFEAASEYFLRAVRSNRSYGKAHYNLALCYYNMRLIRKARAHLKRAIELGVNVPADLRNRLLR